MTGIAIEIKSTTNGPEVWYRTKTHGQSIYQLGDDGLELILQEMPVAGFREAWRTKVLETRDLMLSRLPAPDGDIIEVLFDISEGFYFHAAHARDPEAVVRRFNTAFAALLVMPLPDDDHIVELGGDEDELFQDVDQWVFGAEVLGDINEPLAGVSEDEAGPDTDGNASGRTEYNASMRFKFAADITRNIEPEISRAVRLSVLEALDAVGNDTTALDWPSREEMEFMSRKYSEELLARMLPAAKVAA